MTRARPLILTVDNEPANLALLDKLLRHQGVDGIEVCQRLSRGPTYASLPILILTALNRPEDTARGLEAGANDFLSKPSTRASSRPACAPSSGPRLFRTSSP